MEGSITRQSLDHARAGGSIATAGVPIPAGGNPAKAPETNTQLPHEAAATSPERKSGGQKVNDPLGKRQKEILCIVGQGIERGEIAEKVFGLERRYRGWDGDLYMGEQRRRRYERRYRQVQPLISQMLKALERRGLVRLTRRRQYVKRVELTDVGRMALAEMAKTVLERQH